MSNRRGRPNRLGVVAGVAERVPDMVGTFTSTNMECRHPTLCAVVIADTLLEEGQQLSGSFSRADTWNFMAARGPDFQRGLDSVAPASNADVVRTIGELLGIPLEMTSDAHARVLAESLRGNEGRVTRARKCRR